MNYINKNIAYEINKLRYDYSCGYNLDKLLYLYSEINHENIEIEINYKPIENKKDKKEKLRIFGNRFVNNNINKCKIIYKDR